MGCTISSAGHKGEIPEASSIPISVVSGDCKGGLKEVSCSQISDRRDWEVIQGGDIGIGPGSYYTDDETISITSHIAFPEESDVWEFIDRFERMENGVYNPVVILEVPKGDSILMRAHRLKFMYQNLDGNTGNSPREFVMACRNFCGENVPDSKVYVRTAEWWKNKKVDKNIVRATGGGVALAHAVPVS